MAAAGERRRTVTGGTIRWLSALVLFGVVLTRSVPAAEPQSQTDTAPWLPSLQTETPEEGFALAVTMARRAVKVTQPDVATLQTLRPT